MAICWHFYHVKLQGKTFRPERGQLQVICSVMDMDANLKVQGSWKNSDLYCTKQREGMRRAFAKLLHFCLGENMPEMFSSIQGL